MNLFSKPDVPKAKPLPSIDTARQTIESQKRMSMLKGRASTMLSSGSQAPTAQRTVTGN